MFLEITIHVNERLVTFVQSNYLLVIYPLQCAYIENIRSCYRTEQASVTTGRSLIKSDTAWTRGLRKEVGFRAAGRCPAAAWCMEEYQLSHQLMWAGTQMLLFSPNLSGLWSELDFCSVTKWTPCLSCFMGVNEAKCGGRKQWVYCHIHISLHTWNTKTSIYEQLLRAQKHL